MFFITTVGDVSPKQINTGVPFVAGRGNEQITEIFKHYEYHHYLIV